MERHGKGRESQESAFSGCFSFLCSLALYSLLPQIRGHPLHLGHWAPPLFQDLVLRCVQWRGNCSWFVTGPVFVVTEVVLDFPTEQLRLIFYLLETRREEIGQGETAHASVLWGKKR